MVNYMSSSFKLASYCLEISREHFQTLLFVISRGVRGYFYSVDVMALNKVQTPKYITKSHVNGKHTKYAY